jgi:uncharacterized protein
MGNEDRSRELTPLEQAGLAELEKRVRETGGLAVAFSGGTDSTLLAAVAFRQLGDRAIAVTATSPTYPDRERIEAETLAAQIGIRHELVESNELDIPGFADNPANRCFFCKQELFIKVREVAARHGIHVVADGTNVDDQGDYRPGRKAAAEAGVISPLLEAGLNKAGIRSLSRWFGLPTAEKPPFACLASRFPYGDRITEAKLRAVDAVESELRALGFGLCRVRHHGDVARVEVEPHRIEEAASPAVRERIRRVAVNAGFRYVTLDLQGYRTGSMNETLPAR